jgi:pentatricopeptide repeat protein
MKNMKLIGLSIITGLLVCAAGVYLYNKEQKAALDFSNLSPRSSDATASVEYLNAQKAVEYYRDLIRKKPEVVQNYVELAQLYIQEARVTALHHEYFPKAERLLKVALEKDPNNFNALITKAGMLATLHQFDEAKQLAQQAITLNPYSAFSYGVLVDCLVELGDYDEAVKTSDKMLSIRPDLRSYARAAYLREIHGDSEGAKEAMKMAGDAGVYGQENRAWAFYNLGKLFLNEGKIAEAEYIFNGILKERPTYASAMSGLAHVRSAQGKHDEAFALLKKAWDTTPEHIFIEELTDLYAATGQTTLAKETIEQVMAEFSDHIEEGWNVDHEYAMFCANHEINLTRALECAQRDYQRRPNNIEALDAYAWTLFKSGNVSEAAPLIEQAMRLGTKNPAMHFRAAMIFNAAGNTAKARALLDGVRYINALYVNEARRTFPDKFALASN